MNKEKEVKDFVNIICNIFNNKKMLMHPPKNYGNEIKYLDSVLKSVFFSTFGKFIDKFEMMLSKYTKSKYVLALNSGTSALDIAIKIFSFKENSEVLMPSISFIATANAVAYNRLTPHFLDVDLKTFGICPEKLKVYLENLCEFKNNKCINKKTGKRIVAIIPVHVFGIPCKIDEIIKISKKFNIKVIEDAAESLGSYYKKKHTGTFGDIGIVSFNGNKIITTGSGGAILTNNKKLFNKAKYLSSTAKRKHPYDFIHDDVGYNYRMSNLNAAVGCGQLEKIKDILKNKRKIFKYYNNLFIKFKFFKIISEPDNCKINFWLQTIQLKKGYEKYRKYILDSTNIKQVQLRPIWKLLSNQKPYLNCPKSNLEDSERLEKIIINLPSNFHL